MPQPPIHVAVADTARHVLSISQISRSISETAVVTWVHAASSLASIELSLHPWEI